MPSEKRPKNLLRRGAWPTALREDEGTYKVRRQPEVNLHILVLEERDDCLYQAVRALTTAGHTPSIVHDEELAAAEILAGKLTHFLLLTAYPTKQPVRVPQLIERLRRRRYRRPINYCAKEEVPPETRFAYEALAVDQVFGLPVRARRSMLTAFKWLEGRELLDAEGLTVLECV